MTNSLHNEIVKITPQPEDLSPQKETKCPLCENSFFNKGNLIMHLARHRKHFVGNKGRRLEALPKIADERQITKLYFCPVQDCIYNEELSIGSRYFTNIKYIRQHYQKVHIKKSFICQKCSKAFTTIKSQNVHELICGKKFGCGTCTNSYTSREALLTHIKRKKHQPYENSKPKPAKLTDHKQKVPIPKLQSIDKINSTNITQNPLKLNPALEIQYSNDDTNSNEIKLNPSQYLYLVKVAFEAKDQECQTDFDQKHGKTLTTSICTLNNNSSININGMFRKDINPTEIISEQIRERKIRENNREAQQHHFSQFYDDSCFDQLVNESNLCDIETQTEIPSVLDQLLQYSNTQTQTCDDFLQELCLADIQTQTNWSMSSNVINERNDSKINQKHKNSNEFNVLNNSKTTGAHDELLVSTETQTSFTQCLLECGENNNVGNSSSYITQHTQTDQLLLDGLFESQDENDFISNFQSTQTQT